MRNHMWLVDWNYPDNEGWNDLTQYVVVYNPNSKLGEIIDKGAFKEEEERLKELNTELKKEFDIEDSDVAFYYMAEKTPTKEELAGGVYADGDIVITEWHGRTYETEDNA